LILWDFKAKIKSNYPTPRLASIAKLSQALALAEAFQAAMDEPGHDPAMTREMPSLFVDCNGMERVR